MECYSVPPSLSHGPGRLRGGPDQLSLAQSSLCSRLLKTDNSGRERKRASAQELSFRLSPILGRDVQRLGLEGWLVTAWTEQGNPMGLLRERSFSSSEASLVHQLSAALSQQPALVREGQLSSTGRRHAARFQALPDLALRVSSLGCC